MPNNFGGEQHHPAYDPRTKLQKNELMLGNTLACVHATYVEYYDVAGKRSVGLVASADEVVVALWNKLYVKRS